MELEHPREEHDSYVICKDFDFEQDSLNLKIDNLMKAASSFEM